MLFCLLLCAELKGIVEITEPKIDFHTNYNPNQKMIGMVQTDGWSWLQSVGALIDE